VETVTGTTYRKRNDFILYNDGINKFHCTVMEWYLLTVVCLCLATNGSSSADPPAGHCLSYTTGTILAVTESQCHSYAIGRVLAC